LILIRPSFNHTSSCFESIPKFFKRSAFTAATSGVIRTSGFLFSI